ncbi:glycosyltransferase family 4 protein [Rubripirellula reticaptiva]|uniref:Alpha-D-kanosaminyltransferase n=1 Tax=Rubripirellula reticaptiva TaxID=2528013 RepID=A0A5C6F4P6_9BACT|nr:glycosyltransferase family 4 protein [Rubripirellula reticaptiva]TWU55490.1 Alpha-D-kanosaminyltransferase [Rubripirellula reticaptiva]
MSDPFFDGTLLIRQRSLPSYRVPLFERIGKMCRRLVVVTSKLPTEDSMIETDQLVNGDWIRLQGRSLGKGVTLVYWQSGLKKTLKSVSADAIITEANPRFVDTGLLKRWSRDNECPILGWGLGTTNFFGHGYANLRNWRRARTLRQFDALIAYGSVAKQQYCDGFGISPDCVFVAHNATSDTPSLGADALRERCESMAATPFTVLTIGRLIANKNLELLIDAAHQLKERGLLIQVVMVGDGSHREALQAHAKRLDVAAFFPGHLEGSQLETVARQAHLFVLPGLGGLAIQQAMAFGLPVIVSQADGTETDLVRPTNGWQVPPNDASMIANAIESAAADRPGTTQKAVESLRIASEEINLSTMATKMIEAVNQTSRIKLTRVNR